MTLSQRKSLASVLLMCGVRNCDANLILSDIEKWIGCSGLEWTILRLKALRSAYLKFLAGNSYELAGFKSKKVNGVLIPKGVWGSYWIATGRVEVSLKVFHIYSAFTLNRITPRQRAKFIDSVKAPFRGLKSMEMIRFFRHFASHMSKPKKFRRRNSLIQEVNLLPPRHRRKFPRDFIKFAQIAKRDGLDLSSLYVDWDGFDGYFEALGERILSNQDLPIGNLGVTQERGGKLRVFAFPNLVFQLLLNPLKRGLLRVLSSFKEDCTYDQQSGIDWVVEEMKQGKTIYSVDLSDATNHFPLDLQLVVLEELCPQNLWDTEVRLWHYVSRMGYGASALDDENHKTVSWSKGQPLGAGPSFPMFAITHHILLHYCQSEVCRAYSSCYRILGDDVVISDEQVYLKYRELLALLECPVSEDKTFCSAEFAEFAGTVIYHNVVYQSTKWKEPNVGNITSDAWLFRDRAVKYLPETWKQVYRVWYSCYCHNSLGLPSEVRCKKQADHWLWQEEQKQKRVMRYKQSTISQLYYSILEEDKKEIFIPQDKHLFSEQETHEMDGALPGFHTITVFVNPPAGGVKVKVPPAWYTTELDLRFVNSAWDSHTGVLRSFRNIALA